MILDIVFVFILLIFGFNGFRKGFLHTIVSLLGWILAIVLAFFSTPYVKNFLLSYTDLYNEIIPKSPIAMDVPKGLESFFFQTISEIIFNIVIFFLIFILLKLTIWFLLHFLTKKDKHSLTGVVDGTFGFIFGLFKGFLSVFVIIAVIMPLSEILLPHLVSNIEIMLESSQFAQTIYDYNPIFFIGN